MKSIQLLLFLLLINTVVVAQDNLNYYNQNDGLALSGYDPVSYYSNDPQKGKSDLNYNYQGVHYNFANAQNLERFKESPFKYEPQYGGWCAYAMGNDGSKVKIDPETFKIIDGKLYLFYNFLFTNTLDDWNEDEGNLKINADKNWAKMLEK